MTVLTITTDYDVYADNVNVKEPSDTSLYFGPAGKGGPYRTAIRFPLNNLPSGLTEADIQQVRLYLYCRTASGAAHLTDVHAYNTNGQTDPASDDAPTIYSRAGSGNLYNDDLTEFRTTGDKWIVLGEALKQTFLPLNLLSTVSVLVSMKKVITMKHLMLTVARTPVVLLLSLK